MKPLPWLLIVALLGGAALAGDAKAPALPAHHARGLVLPPKAVLDARHAAHNKRHAALHAKFAAAANLPAAFDCSADCTPVKDQGSCGSCWDFSGTCLVESANILAHALPDNTTASQLSEQYTLDQCDGSNGGCNGDDNTTVLDDAKNGGLPLTSAYGPYIGAREPCKDTARHARSHRALKAMALSPIADWGYVGTQTGVPPVAAIKAAMMQYGPIGCAVGGAGMPAFQNYAAGTVFAGCPGGIDHDVVLVGWDDTKGNGGAWKMRNSWGESWGNAGYMWIEYGANKIGYEAVWATAGGSPTPPAPPTPPTPPTSYTLPGVTLPADAELYAGEGRNSPLLGRLTNPAGQYDLTITPVAGKHLRPPRVHRETDAAVPVLITAP